MWTYTIIMKICHCKIFHWNSPQKLGSLIYLWCKCSLITKNIKTKHILNLQFLFIICYTKEKNLSKLFLSNTYDNILNRIVTCCSLWKINVNWGCFDTFDNNMKKRKKWTFENFESLNKMHIIFFHISKNLCIQHFSFLTRKLDKKILLYQR